MLETSCLCRVVGDFFSWKCGEYLSSAGLLSYWRALGFNLLAYDYRGYGSSEGRPTEAGTYQDLQAAIAWAKDQGFDESRILLLGKSLGGGVSSQVAANQKVAGLILHSTFTSLPDLAKELFPWLPVKSLSKMQFNTRSHLERVSARS